MPKSKPRPQRRDREHAERQRAHRPRSYGGACTRCGHDWPCPSAVAGIELPPDVPCSLHEPADEVQAARVHLTALDLVQDTGRRNRIGGDLYIRWALHPRVTPFIAEIQVDMAVYGTSPDEDDIRSVLRWLIRQRPVKATRAELAAECSAEIEMPAAHVARCLFWAQVFGLVDGPV